MATKARTKPKVKPVVEPEQAVEPDPPVEQRQEAPVEPAPKLNKYGQPVY